eukprot:CAMPEP_0170577958 /NCGR_PEP_ID=MMETSP0224-20130122/5204_1 /TAXON_ID=285029 /ORGANISM="Togula jolla, Strain CCCM 725" /LENGTH=416 /DNA_ID=CAMNT_0010900903 /DNA_START=22 /DNA_END=1272 /DNA_ORIENTATION=-
MGQGCAGHCSECSDVVSANYDFLIVEQLHVFEQNSAWMESTPSGRENSEVDALAHAPAEARGSSGRGLCVPRSRGQRTDETPRGRRPFRTDDAMPDRVEEAHPCNSRAYSMNHMVAVPDRRVHSRCDSAPRTAMTHSRAGSAQAEFREMRNSRPAPDTRCAWPMLAVRGLSRGSETPFYMGTPQFPEAPQFAESPSRRSSSRALGHPTEAVRVLRREAYDDDALIHMRDLSRETAPRVASRGDSRSADFVADDMDERKSPQRVRPGHANGLNSMRPAGPFHMRIPRVLAPANLNESIESDASRLENNESGTKSVSKAWRAKFLSGNTAAEGYCEDGLKVAQVRKRVAQAIEKPLTCFSVDLIFEGELRKLDDDELLDHLMLPKDTGPLEFTLSVSRLPYPSPPAPPRLRARGVRAA